MAASDFSAIAAVWKKEIKFSSDNRMSSLFYGLHFVCFACCGRKPGFGKSCVECKDMSDDVMVAYVKHQNLLTHSAL